MGNQIAGLKDSFVTNWNHPACTTTPHSTNREHAIV